MPLRYVDELTREYFVAREQADVPCPDLVGGCKVSGDLMFLSFASYSEQAAVVQLAVDSFSVDRFPTGLDRPW
jgi:hypothetical protein